MFLKVREVTNVSWELSDVPVHKKILYIKSENKIKVIFCSDYDNKLFYDLTSRSEECFGSTFNPPIVALTSMGKELYEEVWHSKA